MLVLVPFLAQIEPYLDALAPTSQRKYRAVWDEYQRWCDRTHVAPLAITSSHDTSKILFAFATHCFDKQHNNARTIRSKLCVINWYHQCAFGSSALLHSGHVIALAALERTRPSARAKAPITVPLLRNIYQYLQRQHSVKHDIIWGSIVLAYFFCMRVGEYAKTTSGTNHAIRQSDITFCDSDGSTAHSLARAHSVTVFFRTSKKDQAGFGQARTLCRSGSTWCCPVISAWRLVAHSQANGCNGGSQLCIYRHELDPTIIPSRPDSRSFKRVTCEQISKTIKQAACNLGLDPRIYSSHSCRSGGATALFLGGATDATVRLFGRWNSDAYLRYLHIATATTNNLSANMLGQAGRDDKSIGGFPPRSTQRN